MEIYTQNLLGISLQESRLQSNFSFIDAALKNINQQLINLAIGHDSIVKAHGITKTNIESVLNRLNRHQNEIQNHSKWIQQMNSQFQSDSIDLASSSEKQLKSFNNHQVAHQNTTSKMGVQRLQYLNLELKKQKANESKLQPTEKQIINGGNRGVGKNTLQRALATLKERLCNLQKQAQANRLPIDEMNKILAKQKMREQENFQRRASKDFSNKRKSMLKNCLTEQSKRDGQVLEGEGKRSSEKSFDFNANQFFDYFAGKSLLEAPQYEKLDVASKEMSKQMQSLKENIIDKIRSIQAQYKQNQNRIGSIQKTVDVIERSYQMLKYDFDRTTSTGWSRQRTNDTQERDKREKNQGRIGNREYYEEKMVEIFQEMDKLKREYIELQTRIENEDVGQIGQLLRSQESSAKLSNYKLISSLKSDGGQSKREVAMLKRDLSKLRVEFQEFTWGVNTNAGETKTVLIKPNQTKQDWKALSTKIYKLKMQLQAGVRDLQGKIVTNNDMVVVLNQLEVGIEQCKLLLKRKVEQSDYQKGLKRVEARLNNFIMQVYQKEGKEQETQAALAKQPWFCLSCDTQVKNYPSKPLKSPTAEKLQGKKVNPQSHMVRRNENGKLPSVVR